MCFKAQSTYSELISSKRTITGLNQTVNMQLYKTGDQEKIEYNTNFTLSHTIEDPAKLGREGGKFSVQATLSKLSFVAHGKKNRQNYNGNLHA